MSEALRRARRAVQHYRADGYILSFPKCGRTWLRLMVAKVFERHFGITVADSMRLHASGSRLRGIPRIRVTHDWKDRRTMTVDRDKSRFRSKRVVLMIRDPRDVVVSQYFHRTRRKKDYTGTLDDFVRSARGSLADVVAYYNVWAAERERMPRFMQVAYEDLRADTRGELQEVSRFLGLTDVDAETVDFAVDFCRFDRMQKMEREQQFESSRLQARDVTDPLSYKARSGRIGGHREHFTPELARFVDDYIDTHLDGTYERYHSSGRATG